MRYFVCTTLISASLLISGFINEKEIIEDISVAIRAGNAKELAKYFNTNIDLNIPGNQGMYSNTQAEQIMKNFFAQNPPESFSVLHKGTSKDGARYTICNLTTAKMSFRTYFLMRKKGETYFIHEFMLSHENKAESKE